MKKFLFSTIMLTYLASFGQTKVYKPFPENYGNWAKRTTHYLVNSMGQPYVHYIDDDVYFTAGDSVSNGLKYKLVNRINFGPAVNAQGPAVNVYYTGGTRVFAYRNDSVNRKVYLVLRDSTKESLWYDFNISVGDTLRNRYSIQDSVQKNCYLVVTRIDSVLECNKYRKQFHGPMGDPMVEGEGFTDNFLIGDWNSCTFEPPTTSKTRTWTNDVSCPAAVGIPVYEIPGKKLYAYPNPVNTILNLEFPEEAGNVNLVVVDILGRNVLDRLFSNVTEQIHLDFRDFPEGIYNIIVKSDRTFYSVRIIRTAAH